MASALDADERHVALDPHATRLQPTDVVESFRKGGRLEREFRRRGDLLRERAGVEHGGDLCPGFDVLVSNEVEQRPGAGQHDAPADRAALRLQRDLRAA